MLWSDKYQPESFEGLTFHNELNDHLYQISGKNDLPHMIFYGPDGAGKRTRVGCILVRLYGKSVLKPIKDSFSVKTPSKIIEVAIRSSRFHIELSPGEAEHNDRLLLSKLIKDAASNNGLAGNGRVSFMTIVLYEAERLSLGAQAALRRIMEKYSDRIRIIMVCKTIGQLIPAIKSRFLLIRVPAPKTDEILRIITDINTKEQAQLDYNKVLKPILDICNRNSRRALLLLQAARIHRDSIEKVLVEQWKEAIKHKIVNPCLKDQSVETLKNIRSPFFELSCNLHTIDEIVWEILKMLCNEKKDNIISKMKEASFYADLYSKNGDNDLPVFEQFATKLMIELSSK